MYILMINIHGLLRNSNIEFGRDADTGGQTRYIIEMVKNLSLLPEVSTIDLSTRLIKDKRVSKTYSEPVESLTEKAKIVRLPCGGFKYLKKEKLWPYLDEYTDRQIEYIRSRKEIPDFVHGHYADSGYIAAQIARIFGIPLIFTAHSLGRNKLSFLIDNGWTHEEADRKLSISTRIRAEEEILQQSDLVITSTQYERDELYGQYEYKSNPQYEIIPPGIELDKFFPYYHYEIQGSDIEETAKQAHVRTKNELKRFHFDTEKPIILSLCRPDARKNIDLLIEAYGKDKELQAMANLAIFAGIREDISEMAESEQQVLTEILLAMDKYDLYGKMAIPKNHNTENDVPELYRIAALKRGVFVSASYLETFGLTFIEASATGLPFIATNKGGPVDIIKHCESGKLIDISKPTSISDTIKEILTDQDEWNRLSENGINQTREVYTWQHHCEEYFMKIKSFAATIKNDGFLVEKEIKSIGKRLDSVDELVIVDIDDTLLGEDESITALMDYLRSNRNKIGFGIATGRDIDSAIEVLKKHNIKDLDILISSVGAEIYYKDISNFDRGWSSHISKNWHPEKIKESLGKLSFLTLQDNPAAQRDFKISYYLDTNFSADESIPLVHNALMEQKLTYSLVFSHGNYLDILPAKASKGRAVRYLSQKWKIPLQQITTAGNSGNDWDMLSGRMKGIVVGNFEPELEPLRKNQSVYFAETQYAAGILEGLLYWKK
ncbi:MAG: HAD-IIB family hydrolase [Spirochaetales bacterium]|nr:HAD-IIB family hydrolase [Spirochaetales bacterium]